VKRKVRVRAPGPQSEARVRKPVKETREKGGRDAGGCTPTTIRATEISGSVQRLR
jgi:hypothetical protein